MNWSRCSRTLPSLPYPVSTATPAAAVVPDVPGLPDRQRGGEERRAAVAPDGLYGNGRGEWTRLTDGARTVRSVTPTGDAAPETFAGRSFGSGVSAANDPRWAEVPCRPQSGPGDPLG